MATANIAASAEMTQITRWEDLSSFEGKIVAFKINTYFGRHISDYYTSPSDRSILFGMIFKEFTDSHPGQEPVYSLRKLLNIHVTIPSNTFLTNSELGRIFLFMREATSVETTNIIMAVDAGQAKFESLPLENRCCVIF